MQKVLLFLGFEASRTTTCVYHHSGKQIKVVAHVDDFLVSGPVAELKSFRGVLQREYEVDGDILGLEVKHGKFLGRVLTWQPWGVDWEADPKLVNGLLAEFGLEGSKGVDTPGVKEERLAADDERTPMTSAEAALYRRGAAKLNYLAQDRLDVCFAAKDISSRMASPRQGDEVALKRAIRYLRLHPRWVAHFVWQDPVAKLVVFSDSDWGGCTRSRRSTSGGIMMCGKHVIQHWSRTQQLVALSSAEAELNATVKGGCESLGLKHMIEEFGFEMEVLIMGDSSANDGILHRAGTGKIKHLSVRQLWLQERINRKELDHVKIRRDDNPSDCLIHHWSTADGEHHFSSLSSSRPAQS